jgi:Fur family transcriptional regulator, peroxide stress response regulator
MENITNGVDMPQPPSDHRILQFERICRARGLPLTVQRRVVLQAILPRKDHPTADQIYAAIRKRLPDISRTSVYRILEMLVQTGMITKVCHPGSAARFDPQLHPHHHLVCLSCERIIDVEEPRLNHLPLPDVHALRFRINDYHVHFHGVCAQCARKQKTSSRRSRPVGRPKAGSNASPPRSAERTGR